MSCIMSINCMHAREFFLPYSILVLIARVLEYTWNLGLVTI
jgi:hypothetical protein